MATKSVRVVVLPLSDYAATQREFSQLMSDGWSMITSHIVPVSGPGSSARIISGNPPELVPGLYSVWARDEIGPTNQAF